MKKIMLSILTVLCASTVEAQMITVSNNLLLDAGKVPNLGIEMTTGNRTTVGINGFYGRQPMLTDGGHLWGIRPEWKYYLSGRPLHGLYVGVGGMAVVYDLKIKRKYYDGNAIGGGMLLGYVLNLSKRVNIDFHSGFGFLTYKQKEYFEGDNYDDYTVDGKVVANAKGSWLLPVDFGITLSYIIR
ncbi:DUF3575 domain-containing protein [Prevotella sp. AGR2160]|uniref:DUF3575 domain-containing protein n=1 Tax=Prevotella sp. AGR2160 TaxID=1280674 RepID=UPI00048EA0F3|nr:DUF3575 domain-containing protein [Prevotella sp. AGR2160]